MFTRQINLQFHCWLVNSIFFVHNDIFLKYKLQIRIIHNLNSIILIIIIILLLNMLFVQKINSDYNNAYISLQPSNVLTRSLNIYENIG